MVSTPVMCTSEVRPTSRCSARVAVGRISAIVWRRRAPVPERSLHRPSAALLCGYGPLVGVPVRRVEVAVGLQALELVAVAVNRVGDEQPDMRDLVVDDR